MITRRNMISGIAASLGLQLGDRMRGNQDAGLARLATQVKGLGDGYEAEAKSCYTLMASLGMDSRFAFKSPADACRMIMSIDQLFWSSEAAKVGYPICEFYSHEGTLLSMQRLAELIPERAGEAWGQTGWTASRIQRVLVIADGLIANECLKQMDEEDAHDLPF